MDPCSVCGKRVGVTSIHCTTCGYWVHGGDVWECDEVWREWYSFVCKMYRVGGRKAADEFHFEGVKLECVGEWAYLGDMLNDTSGVEQAVAARVRAAWMKFKELGGILCM